MHNQDILKYLNRQIKHSRPDLPIRKVCQVFRENDLLEIGFLSKSCKNDASGSCIMCDYGCASGTKSNEEYILEMKNILNEINFEIDTLLLCTNGSFFDEHQISNALFRDILSVAAQYNIPTIEFETHYLDVTFEKLDTIHKILPDKHIMIEMGLETVNSVYQNDIIMKNINLNAYENTINLIQSFGFTVETNIMLGLPFLSAREQIEDAENTINWALFHDCKIVLFPINIKPFTLLMQMYETKLYNPISHWLLIILLDRIPENDLDKITIAWYGNREEKYDQILKDTIFPTTCPICTNAIKSFYSDFLKEKSANSRKKLIEQLIKSIHCNCYDKQINLLNINKELTYKEVYTNFCSILQEKYIR